MNIDPASEYICRRFIEGKTGMADGNVRSEIMMPRRPVRANGQRKYEQLVATVEEILDAEGIEALNIQLIAERAGVPNASVYHFFPHTTSACIAVAERYFDQLGDIIRKPESKLDAMDWREYVSCMMARAIAFYNANDCARQLILGSNYSWQVRQADLHNNRVMANALFSIICVQYDMEPTRLFQDAVVISISIGEAIWSLSVAETGRIERQYEQESYRAVCAYLADYFEKSQ